MKRSIILLIISFIMVFTGMIHAQGRRGDRIPPIPNEEQIQKMVDELSGKLNLTDEQKSRIENLYREHFETMKKLHEQKNVTGKNGIPA